MSDPANPVPYRPRPISPTYPGPDWPKWLVQDQRFVDHRPDVLTWETEPLSRMFELQEMWWRTFCVDHGTDADWIVKLIDVQPEDAVSNIPEEGTEPARKVEMGGFELMIADEVYRSRFLHGFENPQPLNANEVVEYKVDLHTADHVFQRGHKIMVRDSEHVVSHH